ncbi:MAG: hypothetical protein ACTHK7_13395 [Aureliella sp.]
MSNASMDEMKLSNEALEVTVVPSAGGRIDSLKDLRTKTAREWIWHPAGYQRKERRLEIGANFDDAWTGGFDEIFPNDAEANFQGRQLAGHGELWSQAWEVSERSDRQVTLNYSCQTVPVDVAKTIQIDDRRPAINLSYRFQSRCDQPLPYLFKLHPALVVEPGDEILLPECLIEPVELGFSSMIGQAQKTRFPRALSKDGQEIAVNIMPEPEEQEFYYATELADGYCGIKSQKTGTSLVFRFDRRDLPYVWMFQSYGKWRGYYVVVPEPCTNIPWDLEKALSQGTCGVLGPHERKAISISVAIEDC